MPMRDWVRLPSLWIENGDLVDLEWKGSGRSDNAAALMVLAPVVHNADDEGLSKRTYDELGTATGLSRSKISGGLSVLESLGVIEREPKGRSTIKLMNYNLAGGWSKFPARRMYSGGRIIAFDEFKLRMMTELHALKLYYLFARRRSNDTNMAHLSYEKIEEYSGIERPRIRRAISLLAAIGLVHVEHLPSRTNDRGTANAYRLALLDPYVHLGTRGRDPDFGAEETTG
jgi:DNA-binding transcriptional ArsR family regulator